MTGAIERVLVVTAHPDDAEFGAGGTIARLVQEGRAVTYVIVTSGDKGSGDDVTRQIRRWRPDFVITQHPARTVRNFYGGHRDHRITAGIVLDCVYPLARDHLAFPEIFPEYEPHEVREVYLVQWEEEPQLIVDITGTIDLKLRAIACHASQVGDFQAVEARVRERSAALGQGQGHAYAEAFDRVVLG